MTSQIQIRKSKILHTAIGKVRPCACYIGENYGNIEFLISTLGRTNIAFFVKLEFCKTLTSRGPDGDKKKMCGTFTPRPKEKQQSELSLPFPVYVINHIRVCFTRTSASISNHGKSPSCLHGKALGRRKLSNR
jgi:hypothetical protein